jgi:hypothetical protein
MDISTATCQRIRFAVDKLRRRMDDRRRGVVEACNIALDRFMALAAKHRSMGYHEGRKVAYADVLGRLKPLGDEDGFGRSTAAFHGLLAEILVETQCKAEEERQSWCDSLKKSEGELRTEWRCLLDEED